MTKLELGTEAHKSLQLLGYLQHNDIEIPETGYNSYGKYKYPLLDDILGAIQPYLSTYQCVILWSEDEHEHDMTFNEEGIEEGYYLATDVKVTCRIQSIENTHDYVQTESHGYGMNKNGDKTLKAQTIARRFSLMCLLGMQKLKAEDTDDSHVDPRQTFSKSKASAKPPSRSTTSKRTLTDLLM